SNTELVVLSACETGLGDIKGNEGVYGLQRAFKIAGVKNLIMSLWQVPDRETMQFMTTFYGHWLDEKRTIPEAFQLTQREMRDRFYNPYSWAGFVLVE
ncbi:MAG: CHAT domain-containing protein, partial [Saprospiraceae bacterium]|nr:CHAT domain-containing protein [Saprospiraceae bacterium]